MKRAILSLMILTSTYAANALQCVAYDQGQYLEIENLSPAPSTANAPTESSPLKDTFVGVAGVTMGPALAAEIVGSQGLTSGFLIIDDFILMSEFVGAVGFSATGGYYLGKVLVDHDRDAHNGEGLHALAINVMCPAVETIKHLKRKFSGEN